MSNQRQRIFQLLLAGAPLDVIKQRVQKDDERAFGSDVNAASALLQRIWKFRSVREATDDWYFSVLRQLRATASNRDISIIDASVESAQFFDDYYALNRPVVLKNVFGLWPQSAAFTMQFFRERFGDAEAEVMLGDAVDRHRNDAYRSVMRLGDFIDLLEAHQGNDAYLVAKNSAVLKGPLREFLDTIEPWSTILSKESPGSAFLWIGPKGTKTHLHYDATNVLHFVIHGSKEWLLIPPTDSCFVYSSIPGYSDIEDVRRPGSQYPLFAYAEKHCITLHAGEALFVPVGWWHYVEGLAPTVAIAFTNFAKQNSFL